MESLCAWPATANPFAAPAPAANPFAAPAAAPAANPFAAPAAVAPNPYAAPAAANPFAAAPAANPYAAPAANPYAAPAANPFAAPAPAANPYAAPAAAANPFAAPAAAANPFAAQPAAAANPYAAAANPFAAAPAAGAANPFAAPAAGAAAANPFAAAPVANTAAANPFAAPAASGIAPAPNAKYQAVRTRDRKGRVLTFTSISFVQGFGGKSHEELRYEHYARAAGGAVAGAVAPAGAAANPFATATGGITAANPFAPAAPTATNPFAATGAAAANPFAAPAAGAANPFAATAAPAANPFAAPTAAAANPFAAPAAASNPFAAPTAAAANPFATTAATAANPFATTTTTTAAANPFATTAATTANPFATTAATTANPFATTAATTANPFAATATANPFAATGAATTNPFATAATAANPFALTSPNAYSTANPFAAIATSRVAPLRSEVAKAGVNAFGSMLLGQQIMLATRKKTLAAAAAVSSNSRAAVATLSAATRTPEPRSYGYTPRPLMRSSAGRATRMSMGRSRPRPGSRFLSASSPFTGRSDVEVMRPKDQGSARLTELGDMPRLVHSPMRTLPPKAALRRRDATGAAVGAVRTSDVDVDGGHDPASAADGGATGGAPAATDADAYGLVLQRKLTAAEVVAQAVELGRQSRLHNFKVIVSYFQPTPDGTRRLHTSREFLFLWQATIADLVNRVRTCIEPARDWAPLYPSGLQDQGVLPRFRWTPHPANVFLHPAIAPGVLERAIKTDELLEVASTTLEVGVVHVPDGSDASVSTPAGGGSDSPTTAAMPGGIVAGFGASPIKLRRRPGMDPTLAPTITEADYFTIPPLKDLAKMTAAELARVQDFTIGRHAFGRITWPGCTDVRRLQVNEIVSIRDGEVAVYCNVQGKPAVGEGLNKRAVVELEGVFPGDNPRATDEELSSYGEVLRSFIQHDKGVHHVSYGNPSRGVWTFSVPHFSRWGLREMRRKAKARASARRRAAARRTATPSSPSPSPSPSASSPPSPSPSPSPASSRGFTGRDGEVTAPNGDSLRPSKAQRRGEPGAASHAGGSSRPHLAAQLGLEPERVFDLAHNLFEPPVGKSPASASRSRRPLPRALRSHNRQRFTAISPAWQHQQPPAAGSSDAGAASASFASSSAPPPSPTATPRPTATRTPASGSGFVPPSTPRRQPFRTPIRIPPHLALTNATTAADDAAQHVPYLDASTSDLVAGAARSSPRAGSRAPGAPSAHTLPPRAPTRRLVHHASRSRGAWPRSSKDFGAFMGRSFRVGWGPNGELLIPGNASLRAVAPAVGRPAALAADAASGIGGSATTLAPAAVAGGRVVMLVRPSLPMAHVQQLTQSLELDLQACVKQDGLQATMHNGAVVPRSGSDDGDDGDDSARQVTLPRFLPPTGDDLVQLVHRHMKHAETAALAAAAARGSGSGSGGGATTVGRIWSLVNALFGKEHDPTAHKGIKAPCDLSEFGGEPQPLDFHERLYRREALSEWLMAVLDTEVPDDGSVWAHLLARRLGLACDAAIAVGNYRLATLLAQAGTDEQPREWLDSQLDAWEDRPARAREYMDDGVWKVYELLAARPVVANDLCWQAGLGMMLWYRGPAAAGVADVLKLYDNGVQAGVVAPPLPAYASGAAGGGDDSDTCYRLLRLFCAPGKHLAHILDPAGYTADTLDVGLAWHLCVVLHQFGQFCAMSAQAVFRLATAYASQLEACGQWHWAMYVLLRLSTMRGMDTASVSLLARDVLHRHVPADALASADWKRREAFLRRKLGVPPQWLHHAIALRAMYDNRTARVLRHLRLAGMWRHYHDAVVRCIVQAPVQPQVSATLRSFEDDLNRLAQHAATCGTTHATVAFHKAWTGSGSMLHQFLSLSTAVVQIVEAAVHNAEYSGDALRHRLATQATYLDDVALRLKRLASRFASWNSVATTTAMKLRERWLINELTNLVLAWLTQVWELRAQLEGEANAADDDASAEATTQLLLTLLDAPTEDAADGDDAAMTDSTAPSCIEQWNLPPEVRLQQLARLSDAFIDSIDDE